MPPPATKEIGASYEIECPPGGSLKQNIIKDSFKASPEITFATLS
jgi:hypothetical protein